MTAVPRDRLRALNESCCACPTVHARTRSWRSQLERRRTALDEGGIDWGQAEALAFASLLVDGIPIRLTGQDTERGTFSQRHLVLHDVAHRRDATRRCSTSTRRSASFEIHNSPLSEYACVGFEYGYSAAAPEALVLWEAQFGDFVNGAQIIIDQFVSSGLSKWRETSRLTLLLPHGYEGNGPEHSSARLERFLQLGAQENLRIVNCTTSAQYFHLLRRQALDATARPLVVMTPKGLLRLKDASLDARRARARRVPARDRRRRRGQARRPAARALHRARSTTTSSATRRAPSAARRRRRAPRAALSVPDRGGARADCALPVPARGRLGAGGAAEHGRLALDPAPARGGAPDGVPLRYLGRPWRASPRRAIRPLTCASRSGSCAPR